jgi:hypothetical protein
LFNGEVWEDWWDDHKPPRFDLVAFKAKDPELFRSVVHHIVAKCYGGGRFPESILAKMREGFFDDPKALQDEIRKNAAANIAQGSDSDTNEDEEDGDDVEKEKEGR